ncbi:MAG: EAL domain-containing protein [Campylobacterales bacterium]|nr:EAL domain-containing protein [Campylobacterales bacterium]
MRESEERFEQLTQFNRTVIWECDAQGLYTYVSDSAYDILGYFPDEMVGHLHCWDLAPEATRERLKAQMLERFAAHKPFRDFISSITHQRGHLLWRSSGALPILASNQTLLGYRGSDRDITDQKRSEETIKTLAFYDTLTGLPNRKLLLDRLKQALAASKRSGHYGAILLLDLDHFKTLNDTMGHQQGDLLLIQVAEQIVGATREGDTVARLGGDEFVVVLNDLGAAQSDAALASETVGYKLIGALDRLYPLDALEYRSSASIGITLFQGDDASNDDLLKQADIAMYRAKESGRNTISFFDPQTEAALHQKALLKEELRHAIEHSELVVFYQAQVDDERRICGAEALVRWNHPTRGLVSPAAFIPIAEESGLIVPLGLWVLRSVAQQSVIWQSEARMQDLLISVNVSVRQFMQHDFVDQVRAVINETHVDPSLLKFEMTESILARNTEEIIVKMEQLKAMGIGFSLDDFGTGYSSLGYLKRLPIDQLKIDQSFVRDILSNPNDEIICKSTIALARSMGLDVIAEGVETLSQRDALRLLGCHNYQGFFFAPALCVRDFELMHQKEVA